MDIDPLSRSAEGDYHRTCCNSWTPNSHVGTCICPIHDMERQGCAHCREKGLYCPPAGSKKASFNLDDIAPPELSIDADDGSVWVSPNEAFLEGRFGQGRHLH